MANNEQRTDRNTKMMGTKSRGFSVKMGLIGIMALFALTLFATVAMTLAVVRSQKQDAVTINLAGRQRMLSQKYVKEVLGEQSERRAGGAAEQLASAASRQIVADRAYYTQNVVGKLKKEWAGFHAGVDYKDREGVIPLPATFLREVSETLSQDSGYRYELLSKWNINEKKGLRDEFENEAWANLAKDPKTPYQKMVPLSTGGAELRYATADVASQACVTCHNNLDSSPKKDFQVGDLMGVLIVTTKVTDDPEFAKHLVNTTAGSAGSAQTALLFEKTAAALREGGETFLDLQMTRPIVLTKMDLPAIEATLAEADATWESLISTVEKVRTAKAGSAAQFAGERQIQKLSNDLLAQVSATVSLIEGESSARVRTLETVQLGALGVAGVTFAFGLWWTRRRVFVPMNAVLTALQTATTGDFTSHVDVRRHDELGRLGEGFNGLAGTLKGVISEISGSANEVASAATEIAASSEEMSAAVSEVARQSTKARESAESSRSIAQEGGAVVNRTAESIQKIDATVSESAANMTSLGKRGEEIGQVIAVINDIADQTNLLALNAAIEAARAGEHGRGFAVVADEVRKLADRTTKATEEIGSSIKAIQQETVSAVGRMTEGTEQVRSGVECAKEAGRQLEQIVSGAGDVASLITAISAASEEAGAGASQASSAAAQLSEKAEQMRALVSKFKVA